MKIGNIKTRTQLLSLKDIRPVEASLYQISFVNIGFRDEEGFVLSALGLKYIHLLTANKDAILRIDLEAFEAPNKRYDTAYAVYGKFWIGDVLSNYTLEEMSDYTGKRDNNTSESD